MGRRVWNWFHQDRQDKITDWFYQELDKNIPFGLLTGFENEIQMGFIKNWKIITNGFRKVGKTNFKLFFFFTIGQIIYEVVC